MSDPFARTDVLDEATLAGLVTRFEARGRHPVFAKMLHEYLEAMDLPPSAAVLDLGCGTGLAARAIAQRPAFRGSITGVDLSPYLVAAAARLARAEGSGARVEFRSGDVRRLDFADGSFDAVVAHTLLSHVDGPLAVLKEAARVLRSGGTIAVFDGDYASLTFDQPDAAKAEEDDEAVVRALVTNPRVMRQMPRLLSAAGLKLVACFSHVLSEAGTAQFWASAIETYRKLIPQGGVMKQSEADAWATGLRNDSEAGVFFASSNYYAYIAKRP